MDDLVKAALTPAQERVAEGILDGLSNAEIAQRLNLGERTVKATLTRIYLKFEIADSLEKGSTFRNRIRLARKLLSV